VVKRHRSEPLTCASPGRNVGMGMNGSMPKAKHVLAWNGDSAPTICGTEPVTYGLGAFGRPRVGSECLETFTLIELLIVW